MLIIHYSNAINLKHVSSFYKIYNGSEKNKRYFGINFSKEFFCRDKQLDNIVFTFSHEKDRDLAFEKIIDYAKSNERVCEL